jgi:hypothetical protein
MIGIKAVQIYRWGKLDYFRGVAAGRAGRARTGFCLPRVDARQELEKADEASNAS